MVISLPIPQLQDEMPDSKSFTRKLTPIRRVVWKSSSLPEIIFGSDRVILVLTKKTTKLLNNVISTSMLRDHVALMLIRRCFDVMRERHPKCLRSKYLTETLSISLLCVC